MKTPEKVIRQLITCTEINMPPNVQHKAMEDAIGCIKQLLNAFNEWEMVAASPGAVEDMARENAQMHARIRHLEREKAELGQELDKVRLSFAQQTTEVAKRNRDMLAAVEKAIAMLPRWISVEERLPDKSHDWVLIIGKWESDGGWIVPHVAEYREGIWMTNGTGWNKIEDLHIKITHWMPLPELPEEDSE